MNHLSNISKIRLRLLVLSVLAIRFIVGAAITSSIAYAQQSGVIGQSEREIRILQERSNWAQTQTQKAITAMADKDYESAFAFSKSAVDALPSGGESSAGLRSLALETFSKSAYALATQRVSEGYYDDAELVVKTATDKPYASSYAPLLDLQKSLRDPNHFNRTITPGFVTKVTQVEQLMNEAEGLYASARFDAAFNKYQMVLNLDPENRSARLGMEKINKQRSSYAETAYTERRSQMISDVARAWELPVPKINTGATTIVEQSPIDMQGTSAISRKLQEIRLPQLSLTDETVREAVEKLQKKSRVLDTTETDPAKKGVNIVLKLDPAKEAVDGGTKLNLSLNDLPLGEALKYIASAANLKVKIEPYAVAIVPLSEPTETLISKQYKVPPGFISSSAGSSPSAGALPTAGVPGASGTVGKSGAKEFLESQGVTFPAGASATYLASSSKLLVKNTQANLDLIDSLVEVSLATPPSQVEIEARFLEVTQNNLQELGFDWLMGAFQLPGGSGVNTGGGTVGNRQGQANRGNYPFVNPANGYPAGAMNVDPAGNVTAGNVTAGNRTGSAAVTANALDALLFGSPAGPAAGVLALAGVFTNPQFQVVLRAINQQKGVDLVSAPKVTVTSGRKATINITQKFPYPRDYSPPTVVASTAPGQIQPANPATPTSFETRNCGVQLEVEPTVGPDGYTIELSLSPQITEFQGFVNYGSPISSIATVYSRVGQISLGTQRVFLTANTINQPVFSVRQVDTQVTVYDGQTVVLGGLMREDVQKVQDKTPIVGDLPLVGSLFRSSNNQRIKRNLLIFVSAGLLDPAGQPLIKTVENGLEISTPDAKAVASEAIPGDPSTASKSSR
ncbi:MAG: Amuc_1098 family type IV pilus outer membrane protein [Verrucomicrobiota bacterium]